MTNQTVRATESAESTQAVPSDTAQAAVSTA